MPKLEFTQQELNGYLKLKKEGMHPFYEKSVNLATAISVHAEGIFPEKLIRERRPNEPVEVLEYREKIWTAKTKPTFLRVLASLMKIRRSQDWDIIFSGEKFTRIPEGESLEDYIEMNFPFFESITNWAFSLVLRKQLLDPNAVEVVKPLEDDINLQPTDFRRPFPEIFDSRYVLDFVEEDYAVIQNPKGAIYYSRGVPQSGRSVYIFTTQQMLRYDQINAKEEFTLAWVYNHALGKLPAFKLKGLLTEQSGNSFLYESRINGMVPELDEAVREYSDLQAARVNHIYPERYEFTNNECQVCRGKGFNKNPLYTGPGCAYESTIKCDECDGIGMRVAGPYKKIVIKSAGALDTGGTIPAPPAGYVEKDVEIVKLQDESVKQHIYDALAAINFQFLEQTPLSESGKAKEVDKDELNNTVHSIAEDLIAILDKTIYYVALFRYKDLYSMEEIIKMLPKIPVPEKFDLLSSDNSADEVAKAKTGKANPVIINALELDYTGKRFYTEPEIRDRLHLILELDPLPNITEDEKMARLSNKGITMQSYVISSNIQEFVRRAIEEDENFPEKKIVEKWDKMKQYATELMEEIKASAAELITNEMERSFGDPADEDEEEINPNETIID